MPKRKAADADVDDDGDVGGTQAAAIDADTAEALANRLCRFVLLREHHKKPLSRQEMKAAVMSEHNDRSGKIFKQVLAAANEKMRHVIGIELVPEAGGGGGGEGGGGGGGDDDGGYGTQAVPGAASQSQAGPSTQAGASQAAPSAASKAKGGAFLVVNKLANPYAFAPSDSTQVYHAFVEVVLTLVQQSEGVLDEEHMFKYLEDLGLERTDVLPQQTVITDKVEALVQKRLVSEAWLRRVRKANDAETWQYVAGSRATLSRSVDAGDEFRNAILSS